MGGRGVYFSVFPLPPKKWGWVYIYELSLGLGGKNEGKRWKKGEEGKEKGEEGREKGEEGREKGEERRGKR